VTTKKLVIPSIQSAPNIKKFGIKDPDHEGHNYDGLFKSIVDFRKRLDIIADTQAEWNELEVKGRNEEYTCTAWMRDPMAVLQEILDNSKIKDKVVWAPRRMYDEAGLRVYTDLYTTEWWWKMQVASTYDLGLTLGIGQQDLREPYEQDDNSDNLDVRQNITRWLFRHGYGVAVVYDDWQCPRIRTI
jgi:hypothetical protein